MKLRTKFDTIIVDVPKIMIEKKIIVDNKIWNFLFLVNETKKLRVRVKKFYRMIDICAVI